jgi:hypothetical protein
MSFAVSINLYDLSQGMAARMSMPLLGKQIDFVPHTGIVVYGYVDALVQVLTDEVPSKESGPLGMPMWMIYCD